MTRAIRITCVMCILCMTSLTFAQAAPTTPAVKVDPKLTDQQRIDILTLANQKHAIKEQMDDLTIKYLQAQLQATNQYTSMQSTMTQIDGQIASKSKDLPYDHEKFDLDTDTATLKEKKTAGIPPTPYAANGQTAPAITPKTK